ncbi:transglycosylase SLT domain-containing protein [Kitasatospora sp. NPDC085879]|uniref:transglycosylase SLT domain-containing protein n=1 Tax=Kitasatospora sp. NPDC085879 TaxID=3154769 RepID=UPI0034188816
MPKHARPRRVPAVLLSGRWITTAALATAAVAVTTANAAPGHGSGPGPTAATRSQTRPLEPTAWSTPSPTHHAAAAHHTTGAIPSQRTASPAKRTAVLPAQRGTAPTHTAAPPPHTAHPTTAPAKAAHPRTAVHPGTATSPTTARATTTPTAAAPTTTPTASASYATAGSHTTTHSWDGTSLTTHAWSEESGGTTPQTHDSSRPTPTSYGTRTAGAQPAAQPAATPSPAPTTTTSATPATGDLDTWINQALTVMAENHVPGSYDGIYRNIMRESSGNPRAINLTDSNAAAGHPSKGLLQVIDPTFQAYHVPGTSTDIYDPVANITAACNYAAHFYGSIDNVNGPY